MTWSAVPEFATPRAMTPTSMVLYSLGGCTGLLAMLGSHAEGPTRAAMIALALCGFAAGVVSLRWGAGWPRLAFYVAVVAATAVVVAGVLVSPDPTTAVVVVTLISSVLIHACYFFDLPRAVIHIVMALGVTAAGLMLRGDAELPTAVARRVARRAGRGGPAAW